MELEKEMIILSNLIKHEMSIYQAYDAIKEIKYNEIFTKEAVDLLKEIANSSTLYSSTRHRIKAKKILKSITK